MAAGTDFSHPFTNVEGGYSNDSCEISVLKDEISDNSNELNQSLSGKPPRLPVVRASINTRPFMSPSELIAASAAGGVCGPCYKREVYDFCFWTIINSCTFNFFISMAEPKP